MLYREAGQFKTSYGADQAVFPILQDRIFVILAIVAAYLVPLVASEYWLQAVLIPFLILALAAIGLNLLTGYAGQLSLGTGGFMAVGGYMTYKITTAFPEINLLIAFILAGLIAALVGLVFGIPSLRIKGFYLAVATLAAQFFILWLFNKIGWFVNYSPSGTITAPPRTFLGIMVAGPEATAPVRYMVVLSIVVLFALAAKNLVRGRIGRSWMAIRDMDIAAEIIGIRPYQTKLLAFAISSFYCGVAGGLYVFCIGGLGSILGSFLGAAFITMVPIFLTNAPPMIGLSMPIDLQKHIEIMLFGSLIVFFLIVEPRGIARLWQIAKEKFRLWPFPY
jgi:branched-chain amino acid transport system permease protein